MSPTARLAASTLRDRATHLGRGVRALALQHGQSLDPQRVVFNSFTGHFSDSPRAIYEEVSARWPVKADWVASEDVDGFPGSVRCVEPYGADFLRSIGSSRFVVSNLQMPRSFQKRRGAVYVQTWHGTPLKRIGFDNPRWEGDRAGLDAMARDFAKWDFLVSQNAFSTQVFRRAFRYDGEVLEVGYPRNDILNAPKRDDVRADVRRQLGIEETQTVVLYAPTWRDDLLDEHGSLRFASALNVNAVHDRLSETHVLLLRLHYKLGAHLGDTLPGVRNVSRYPDIRDLYLAADVLVTDYSSAMFDFAVTGKPIIVFAYDLAAYRDDLRGLYLDLETEAPGPVCRTTEELIETLLDAERATAGTASRYAQFRERFCSLDDGRASQRVIDRVFVDAFG